MNENLLDWLETDDFDTYGENLDGEYGDSIYEGEDYDAEVYDALEGAESRSSRRRARAIQAAQARRRRQAMMARKKANMRGRGAPRSRGAPSSRRPSASTPEGREIQKTQEGIEKAQQGIEKVELENQVQSDVFGRALVKQQARIGRNEHALAASIVRGEIERHFPNLVDDPLLKSAIALAPNLMLGFGRGAKGIEGVLTHPAVWSAIATIGVAVIAKTQKQTLVVKMATEQITMPPGTEAISLAAFVADRNGQRVSPQPEITWSSSDKDVADVNKTTGRVTRGTLAGNTFIEASAAGAQSGSTTVIVEDNGG